jgi:hypothetical protein
MTQPFLSQAKQREDEQDHDDQADEIDQTMHVALPKLPLPWQPESKLTWRKQSSGGAHGTLASRAVPPFKALTVVLKLVLRIL